MYTSCCRRTSYINMPAAVATLSESNLPLTGILSKPSQFSLTSRCSPFPSRPITSAIRPTKSIFRMFVPRIRTPHPKPHILQCDKRPRYIRHLQQWDHSMAPAEVRLKVSAFSPTERLLGTMTAKAQNCSAALITAPKFRGSVTPSNSITKLLPLIVDSISLSDLIVPFFLDLLTSIAYPRCFILRVSLVSVFPGTWRIGTPCSFANFSKLSARFDFLEIRSVPLPRLIASATPFAPVKKFFTGLCYHLARSTIK